MKLSLSAMLKSCDTVESALLAKLPREKRDALRGRWPLTLAELVAAVTQEATPCPA